MTFAMDRPAEPAWDYIDGAVLLAGDPLDVPAMVDIAHRLPVSTHGLILVEAHLPIQVQHVRVPDNVAVTWLVMGDQSHPAGGTGARLGMAVHAWCAEWACRDDAVSTRCTVWLGPRTSPYIVRMTRALVEAV